MFWFRCNRDTNPDFLRAYFGVEMPVHFGGTQHHEIDHGDEIPLAVPVVAGERDHGQVPEVFAPGAHFLLLRIGSGFGMIFPS